GHDYARPEHPRGPWTDIPHATGQVTESHQLVCSYVGAVDPSPRHGLWTAIFAPRRVCKMGSLKRTILPDYRAKEHPYRTDYRASMRAHKTDNRSYCEQNRHFPGPIIGHLLDK